MTISEAIQKAIEGGWQQLPKNCSLLRIEVEMDRWLLHFWDDKAHQSDVFFIPLHKTFLQPLFWQALGKAMGWKYQIGTVDGLPVYDNKVWLENWHKFIDFLSEGKTAEDYFNQL